MKVKSAGCSVVSDSLRPHVLSMEFSRQEYWSGLPFPPPGDLPDPGIELTSPEAPALQADVFFFLLTAEPLGKSCLSPDPPQFHSKKNQPFWFSLIGKKWYLCTFYIWTVLSGGLTILTLHGHYVFVAISSNCYFHSVKSCIQVDVCWLISFRNIIYWVLLQYVRIELTVSSVLYVFSLSNLLSFLFHLWKEYSWLSTYGSDMFSFKIDFVF